MITTAKPGAEQGAPFGAGVKGLEAWSRAAQTGSDVGRLREFLLSGNIEGGLKEFLRSASEEEIRTELLQRVSWETEEKPAKYVKEEVRRRLIAFGEKKAPAQESMKVADSLFEHAFAVALRRGYTDRFVDHSDLIQIFDEKTALVISRPEAQAAALAYGFVPQLPSTDLFLSVALLGCVSGPPPAPAQVAARASLVSELRPHCPMRKANPERRCGNGQEHARQADGDWRLAVGEPAGREGGEPGGAAGGRGARGRRCHTGGCRLR